MIEPDSYTYMHVYEAPPCIAIFPLDVYKKGQETGISPLFFSWISLIWPWVHNFSNI